MHGRKGDRLMTLDVKPEIAAALEALAAEYRSGPLVAICSKSPIGVHSGKERWRKRSALLGRIRRVGGGIAWRLKGIGRWLRKYVEN